MKEIIYSYILMIKKFKEELCLKHNLKNDSSWDEIINNINKKANIGKIQFNFHGAGCRLQIDKQICEFDYAPTNEYPVKFDLWKIIEFINSNVSFKRLNYSENDVLKKINLLVDEGILSKLKVGDIELNVYQINLEYYENPSKLLELKD